jgi:hypothetical protein
MLWLGNRRVAEFGFVAAKVGVEMREQRVEVGRIGKLLSCESANSIIKSSLVYHPEKAVLW